MTFPVGCVTRPLTAQAPFAEDGAPLEAELVITASTPLIWAATGRPLQPTYRSHEIDPATGMLTLVIPTTNQASGSWLKGDGSGAPIASGPTSHSHTYSGTLTYTDEETGQRVVRTVGPFVHPVGDGSPLPVEKLTNWSGSTAGPIFVPDAITAAQQASISAAASAASAASASNAATNAATVAAGLVAEMISDDADAAAASAADAAESAQWVEDHWPGPSGTPPFVREFTSTSSFTVPNTVNYGYALLEAWGGGGAGGSSDGASVDGASGGGGGAYSSTLIPFSALLSIASEASAGRIVTAVVGAGGIPGGSATAGAGGVSTISVSYGAAGAHFLVSAYGGGSGAAASTGGGGGGSGTAGISGVVPFGTGRPATASVAAQPNGASGAGGGLGNAPGVTLKGDPGLPAVSNLGGGGGGGMSTFGQNIRGGGIAHFGGGGGGGGGLGSPVSGPSASDGGYGGYSAFGGYGGGGGGGYASTRQGVGNGLPLGSAPMSPYSGASGVGGSAQSSGVPRPGTAGGAPAAGGGGASGGTVTGSTVLGGAGGAGRVRITLY